MKASTYELEKSSGFEIDLLRNIRGMTAAQRAETVCVLRLYIDLIHKAGNLELGAFPTEARN